VESISGLLFQHSEYDFKRILIADVVIVDIIGTNFKILNIDTCGECTHYDLLNRTQLSDGEDNSYDSVIAETKPVIETSDDEQIIIEEINFYQKLNEINWKEKTVKDFREFCHDFFQKGRLVKSSIFDRILSNFQIGILKFDNNCEIIYDGDILSQLKESLS
jgi:hypothetical protein